MGVRSFVLVATALALLAGPAVRAQDAVASSDHPL
jgi:hypothetical protein